MTTTYITFIACLGWIGGLAGGFSVFFRKMKNDETNGKRDLLIFIFLWFTISIPFFAKAQELVSLPHGSYSGYQNFIYLLYLQPLLISIGCFVTSLMFILKIEMRKKEYVFAIVMSSITLLFFGYEIISFIRFLAYLNSHNLSPYPYEKGLLLFYMVLVDTTPFIAFVFGGVIMTVSILKLCKKNAAVEIVDEEDKYWEEKGQKWKE